jgi:predicted ester cyclase
MMASQNVQLVHRWFDEIWTKGNLSVIDEILSPYAQIHGLGETDRKTEGHQSFKDFVSRFRSAFSDIRIVIEQTVEEGDIVASRWEATMRHTGAGMGIEPTGNAIKVTGMSMGRFHNGRMIEGWNNWDQAGLMAQLQGPQGLIELLPED